jgi:hypothetical protein
MTTSDITDELRRFIHSISSVPHLEAMLLLRASPSEMWDADLLARRLYMGREQADAMLKELVTNGICKVVPDAEHNVIYSPAFPQLAALLDEMALYYPRHIIQVTNMIHSKGGTGRRAQMFADAFKFRKDK